MEKIIVSGAHSDIGKTALASWILQGLKRWSALKVTVVRGASCPRGRECAVCAGLKGDFELISDKKTIEESGTDTARLKEAGAKKVLWLKANTRGLEAGLREAFNALKGSNGVVIEGTSVFRYVKPDLGIFIDDKSRAKRRAREARKKADIIIEFHNDRMIKELYG